MLTDAAKEILNRLREPKIRVSVCDKPYYYFELVKHNIQAQRESRKANLLACIENLNETVNDTTFKFVVWDYDTFYSVQLFEGDEHKDKESVTIGEVNTNWADENNLYYKRPMLRKRFKSLKSVERFINYYYREIIKPAQDYTSLYDVAEVTYEIEIVRIEETKIKSSRAVVFTLEMMIYWEKHKLLPIIKTLYNGKRYNRSVHAKKVITALQQGKIVKQDQHYIIFWNL